jgi:hypothetical protein
MQMSKIKVSVRGVQYVVRFTSTGKVNIAPTPVPDEGEPPFVLAAEIIEAAEDIAAGY